MNRYSAILMASVAVCVQSGRLNASVVDTISLTTPSNLSFTDNQNVVYSLTDLQPAGSGTFHPFMRLHRDGDEQGYNSSLNNGPNATMDLINLPGNSSSQLNFFDLVDGSNRLMLTLDYNEPGSGSSTLRLEELVLVVSTDPNKTGPEGPGNHGTWTAQGIPMAAGDVMLYQMSAALNGAGNGYNILLDAQANLANGNGGSGTADLNVGFDLSGVANLPSLLDGSHYLYVYSRFSGAEAGFEEWAAFHPENPGGGAIPEPASLGVLGVGAGGLMIRRRRR